MQRWFGAGAIAAILAAGGPAVAETMKTASPSVNLSNAAVYVAEELGYFRQLNVDLQNMSGVVDALGSILRLEANDEREE